MFHHFIFRWRELARKGRESKIPLKDDDTDVIDAIVEQLHAAQILRDTAKTNDEKLEAAAAMDAAKILQKNVCFFLFSSVFLSFLISFSNKFRYLYLYNH